ncbi:MAG: hypothetical protein KDJ48_01430 [Nitratireductor sp.]|nr:hypothetical protein [Nitratireductor sp.]
MSAQSYRHKSRISGWVNRLEYNLLMLACFMVCLPVIAIRRITGMAQGSATTPANTGNSVFAEARSAACAAAGYAFLA